MCEFALSIYTYVYVYSTILSPQQCIHIYMHARRWRPRTGVWGGGHKSIPWRVVYIHGYTWQGEVVAGWRGRIGGDGQGSACIYSYYSSGSKVALVVVVALVLVVLYSI